MWIRGRGVVSFPCDNRRYDHGGERAVADVVLVVAPAILRFDEDRATLSPTGGWQLEDDERCIGGDYARTSAAGATARFEIELHAPGDYYLELRWPNAQTPAGGLTCAIDDREPLEVFQQRPANRWVRLGTLALTGEPVVVVVSAVDGEPFALDALQLVEVPADGR